LKGKLRRTDHVISDSNAPPGEIEEKTGNISGERFKAVEGPAIGNPVIKDNEDSNRHEKSKEGNNDPMVLRPKRFERSRDRPGSRFRRKAPTGGSGLLSISRFAFFAHYLPCAGLSFPLAPYQV
jgi:hypothetical protein